METSTPLFLARDDFPLLLQALTGQGYRLHGPAVADGAIVYTDLDSVEQLPEGYQEKQSPGRYRLEQHDSKRYFHWANGPYALKPLLFPARDVMWQAKRDPGDGQLKFIIPEHAVEKVAVVGAKACDIAAMQLQDKHFLNGEYEDPAYKARREGLLIIGVNCSYAAETCFCVSTGDGPHITQEQYPAVDIVLTELEHGFLVTGISAKGLQLIDNLPLSACDQLQLKEAEQQKNDVEQLQQRTLPYIAQQQLQQKRAHPQWDNIAERCLACGNCTMVCPTCFCHHQSEALSIDGNESTHTREWDSCFGESHGQLAGLQVRKEIKQRYQQWMIHKLDTWQEQYDRSGCVGCGRCISWCPAEIDFTEEAHLLMVEVDDE